MVATTLKPNDPAQPPDLQLQVNRNLGNGDAVVDCRSGAAVRDWGGVPAVDPPTYVLNQTIIDAMTDFVCRWSAQAPDSPCTLGPSGDYQFLNPDFPDPGSGNVQQFCRIVESPDVFPNGDTIVTARVRDTTQNPGPTKQNVVRIATPVP